MAEGPRAVIDRLPSTPGVYRFRDERGRVLYVGRAVDLRRRVASYWGDLRDRRHLVRMMPQVARIEAAVCDSPHEAAWFERNLLEHRKPRWNRIRGTEVPVYICLVDRPRSPGLAVVHSPRTTPNARHFGPYLGGDKARLAVSALHRALPLAYAGDGLGGSERDMARVRGVGPEDRDALIRAVTGVLDRDPATVASLRTDLADLRDRAANALAFELAARLQAELEAVDWVVGEQKVTLIEPDDFDVHGWADGFLVRFEVRGGRLRAWHQRACAEATARPRLVSTPPAWTRFAQRNAELAARLAG